MNYETMSDYDISIGTFKVGMTFVGYDDLVYAFGEPLPGDGDKTRCEWVILFTNDEGRQSVATIYDWKRDEPLHAVRAWTIGGRHREAVELVNEALDYARKLRLQENDAIMHQWDYEWAQSDRAPLN